MLTLLVATLVVSLTALFVTNLIYYSLLFDKAEIEDDKVIYPSVGANWKKLVLLIVKGIAVWVPILNIIIVWLGIYLLVNDGGLVDSSEEHMDICARDYLKKHPFTIIPRLFKIN